MDPSSGNRASFEPIDSSKLDRKDDEFMELANQAWDQADNFVQKAPVHLEYLILNLQKQVESGQDEKIYKIDKQLTQWNNEIEKKMKLQDLLKTGLDNPNAPQIDLSNASELIGQVADIFQNANLKKGSNKWDRKTAQALYEALKTDRDGAMRKYQHMYTQLQWAVENRHELLKIFREMLEMLRKHKESIVSHSIPR
jgi:hypothetical protein